MFKITKHEAPDYFATAKRRVVRPLASDAWKDRAIAAIRQELRKTILLEEQYGLCAYCEKEIDETAEKSNIDHFKTRHLFPKLTLDYNNLLVSCNANGRCSDFKDNHIQRVHCDTIIHPVVDNPNAFFDYHLTGEIHAKRNLSAKDEERAELTLALFQLNHQSLIQERKTIARHLEMYHGEISIEDVFECLSGYRSFIAAIFTYI